MITVLIADDEPMLRMALKSIVPWEKLGCRIIGEAANGKAACSFIDNTVPDILITDIKMPEMNGIDLIRNIRKKEYKTQVLVLSGFDDFEYVREALMLGAADYILKPYISEQKLRETLEKVISCVMKNKMERDNKDSDKKTEQELLERYLLYEREEPQYKVPEIGMLREKYYFICIRLCYNRLLKQTLREKKETLSNAVTEIMYYYYGKKGLICQTDFREWIILMPQENFVESEMKEMLDNVPLYTGVSAIAGVSSLGDRTFDTKDKIKECREAVEYGFYSKNVIYYYSEKYLIPLTKEFWRTEIPQEILRFVQTENWQEIKKYELPFLKQGAGNYHPKKLKVFVLEYLLFVQSHLAGVIKKGEKWFSTEEVESHLEKIDTWEEMYDFVHQSVSNLCDYVSNQLRQQYSLPVIRAIQYIDEHYSENISMGNMAAEIGMNPTYLSRLFMKEKEITCTEYLNSVRIDHAKELLKDKHISVEEVAGQVGYMNSKYFFRVFKKTMGISPLKYRQRLLDLK